MSYDPVKLPNDPSEALAHVASYLRTVRNDRSRQHMEPHSLANWAENGGEVKKEIVGYWQTPEWIDMLLELAVEAERVAKREVVPA